MVSNGKRIAYGRNQNRVNTTTYPDDTSVPVRTSHWNQDPHDQAILGFTKITATLDASGVIYTKDDSSTYAEDDGSTYSRQSTLIEVECTGSTTIDAIVKIDVTDTNENDILYLFKGTASDTITIADATPSVAGHIKTQLSGGATLAHDGVPIMLIRRGDYWYEFGADGAASTFTATSTDTLENKTINTSDNTITVASSDVTGLSSSLALKAPLDSPALTSPSISYAINTQTVTAYTPVLADAGKIITCSNGSAITFTIPPNSSVAYPIGSSLTVISIGVGLTTFAQGSGVTIASTGATATAPILRVRHSSATAIKIGTDLWQVVGDIS